MVVNGGPPRERDLLDAVPVFVKLSMEGIVSGASAVALPDINDSLPFVGHERVVGHRIVVRGPAEKECVVRVSTSLLGATAEDRRPHLLLVMVVVVMFVRRRGVVGPDLDPPLLEQMSPVARASTDFDDRATLRESNERLLVWNGPGIVPNKFGALLVRTEEAVEVFVGLPREHGHECLFNRTSKEKTVGPIPLADVLAGCDQVLVVALLRRGSRSFCPHEILKSYQLRKQIVKVRFGAQFDVLWDCVTRSAFRGWLAADVAPSAASNPEELGFGLLRTESGVDLPQGGGNTRVNVDHR